jgi:hypothetical protein
MSTRTLLLPGDGGTPPQVLTVPATHRLSRRGWALAWALAVVLLLGGTAALAVPRSPVAPEGGSVGATDQATGAPVRAEEPAAHALSGSGAGTDLSGTGVLRAEWDGPTTHLDWTGRTSTTAEASFVGDRTAAPGDRVQRTLRLANAGPGAAVLTLSLVLTTSSDHEAAPDLGGLGEAVDLYWDVAGVTGAERFATLRSTGPRVDVAHVRVPRGETALVTVGYAVPAELTGARSGDDDAGTLRFDVAARLQGETAPAATPALAVTGAQVAGAVAVAVGLLAVGWLLVTAARGRRCCDVCGAVTGRGQERTEHHAADGVRSVRCGTCAGGPGPLAVAARVRPPGQHR